MFKWISDIFMGFNRIRELAPGMDATDAVNKAQFDTRTQNTGTPNSVVSTDNRNLNLAPKDVVGLRADFTGQAALAPAVQDKGLYSGVLSMRAYSSGIDFSGGLPFQIFSDFDAKRLFFRRAASATGWEAEKEFAFLDKKFSMRKDFTKSFPVSNFVVGNWYELVEFTIGSMEGVYELCLIIEGSGFGVTIYSETTLSYHNDWYTIRTGVAQDNVWIQCPILYAGNRHLLSSPNDLFLEQKVNGNSVRFRVKQNIALANGAQITFTISPKIDINRLITPTFIELTGTGNDTVLAQQNIHFLGAKNSVVGVQKILATIIEFTADYAVPLPGEKQLVNLNTRGLSIIHDGVQTPKTSSGIVLASNRNDALLIISGNNNSYNYPVIDVEKGFVRLKEYAQPQTAPAIHAAAFTNTGLLTTISLPKTYTAGNATTITPTNAIDIGGTMSADIAIAANTKKFSVIDGVFEAINNKVRILSNNIRARMSVLDSTGKAITDIYVQASEVMMSATSNAKTAFMGISLNANATQPEIVINTPDIATAAAGSVLTLQDPEYGTARWVAPTAAPTFQSAIHTFTNTAAPQTQATNISASLGKLRIVEVALRCQTGEIPNSWIDAKSKFILSYANGAYQNGFGWYTFGNVAGNFENFYYQKEQLHPTIFPVGALVEIRVTYIVMP